MRDMKASEKILVGGEALRKLGSDRYTHDTDYLINLTSSKEAFLHDEKENADYLNANGNKFFKEIYEIEKGKEMASPQSLFDLKAYAFVQHCQNFNFAKADACEYDLKFLAREFRVSPKIVKKYISNGELAEIMKVIQKY